MREGSVSLRRRTVERNCSFIYPLFHVTVLGLSKANPLPLNWTGGRNGKPQAVRVLRRAVGIQAPSRRFATRRTRKAGRPLWFVLTAIFVVACIAYSYNRVTKHAGFRPPALLAEPVEPKPSVQNAYRCDGRTYCSQMTSCAEATYFLNNCAGVKMDGNNDGIPCEQQWCR